MTTDTMDQTSEHGVDPGWAADETLVHTLVAVLRRRKLVILASSAIGGLACAIYLLIVPNTYTATTMIMPPQQQQSSVTAMLGQLGPLANLGGRDLGIKNPSDLYLGILRSRTIADAVIGRFQLQGLYGTDTMVQTRDTLAVKTRFDCGRDGLIKVSVEDRDPKRAADLANAYIDELYLQNGRLALSEAAQRRVFFEGQLDAEKNALADAEASFRSMQERTGMLQVDKQVEAVVRSMAQLRAAIASGEVALERMKTGATAQNPQVIRQESEVAALRSQLARLEATQAQTRPGDTLIPTSRLPQAGLAYIRSFRDLKYHETLFELLAKQYEGARIDEAKQAPVIQVIDKAVPPDKKSWPPRALLTAAATFASGLLACAAVFAQHHLLRSPMPQA